VLGALVQREAIIQMVGGHRCPRGRRLGCSRFMARSCLCSGLRSGRAQGLRDSCITVARGSPTRHRTATKCRLGQRGLDTTERRRVRPRVLVCSAVDCRWRGVDDWLRRAQQRCLEVPLYVTMRGWPNTALELQEQFVGIAKGVLPDNRSASCRRGSRLGGCLSLGP